MNFRPEYLTGMHKARYQPRSAMRVVHRERKEKITCLKNIHSDAINKNTNK